jgi:ParB/RepB/Spo0J family partition protein
MTAPKKEKRVGAKDFQSVDMVVAMDSIYVNHEVNVRTRNKLNKEGQAEYEKITALAASMKDEGLLQHPVLRQLPIDSKDKESPLHNYQLFVGFRRHSAATRLKWKTLPVRVFPADTPDEVMIMANFVENAQRSDLSPYDKAARYDFMMDEYDLSGRELSRRIGDAASHVQNMVRVFRNVDPRIKQLWKDGDARATPSYLMREIVITDKETGELMTHSRQWELWLKGAGNKDADGGINDNPSDDTEGRGARVPDGQPTRPSKKVLRAALISATKLNKEIKSDNLRGIIQGLEFALGHIPGIDGVYDPDAEKAAAEQAKALMKAEKDKEKNENKAKKARESAAKRAEKARKMLADAEEEMRLAAEADLEADNAAKASNGAKDKKKAAAKKKGKGKGSRANA